MPPLLSEYLGKLRRRGQLPEWERWNGTPDRPGPAVRGWEDPSVGAAYKRRWARWIENVDSTRPLAFSIYDDQPLLRYDVQHQNMTVAWVLSLAAARSSRVSVLDWGGGVGQLAAVARALRPDLGFGWVVHDVPSIVDTGIELQPAVEFCSDDTCLRRDYDLVIAKSSLQYFEDWESGLASLAGAARRYVYVSETPFVDDASSYPIIQRPRWAWDTEYVGWALQRSDFLAAAERAGLALHREVMSDFAPDVAGAPEQPRYGGYLLSRASPRVASRG